MANWSVPVSSSKTITILSISEGVLASMPGRKRSADYPNDFVYPI
jgi:hypothetical protein